MRRFGLIRPHVCLSPGVDSAFGFWGTGLSSTPTEKMERLSIVRGQGGGQYSTKDNVLMLVKNGKSQRYMIFPVAGDGMVCTKQK